MQAEITLVTFALFTMFLFFFKALFSFRARPVGGGYHFINSGIDKGLLKRLQNRQRQGKAFRILPAGVLQTDQQPPALQGKLLHLHQLPFGAENRRIISAVTQKVILGKQGVVHSLHRGIAAGGDQNQLFFQQPGISGRLEGTAGIGLPVIGLHQTERAVGKGFEQRGHPKIIKREAFNNDVRLQHLRQQLLHGIGKHTLPVAALPAGHAARAGRDAQFAERRGIIFTAESPQKGLRKKQRIAAPPARTGVDQKCLHLFCS